jgi:hypothetical protein
MDELIEEMTYKSITRQSCNAFGNSSSQRLKGSVLSCGSDDACNGARDSWVEQASDLTALKISGSATDIGWLCSGSSGADGKQGSEAAKRDHFDR